MTTNTKIRAVGNSKGVIIPKKYLDLCGIEESVNITMKGKIITIAAAKKTSKKKWSDFKPLKKEKVVLVINKFDETDWTW